MKRAIFTTLALSAVFAVGCDDQNVTPTTEVKDAANSTGNNAADAMDNVSDAAKQGVETTKDKAAIAKEAAVDEAAAVENSITTLVDKAKVAVKDAKFADAENYITQIEGLKSKLPVAAQVKIDSAIAEVKKLIESGKALKMPG